jgi:hypothetical protein
MRFMLLETYGSCSGHSDKPSGSSGGIHVCPTGAVLPRPTGDGGTPSAEMQERPQSAQKTSGGAITPASCMIFPTSGSWRNCSPTARGRGTT